MALTKIQQPLLPPEVIFATNWVLTTGVNLSSLAVDITSLSGNNPVKFTFTPSVPTSAFALTGIPISTNPSNYRVDIDGVLQEPGTDYYISGSNIIFTVPVSSDEKVVVVANRILGSYELPIEYTITPIVYKFTTLTTTSAFTLTGSNLSTSAGNYRVDINGVLQEPNTDYYLSGSNIIFTTPISAGEKVVVVGNQPVGTFDPSFSPVIATGTTTPRTLQNRFADVINVKDFGAVGDGVTDDTAAIQAAINSLTSGGQINIPKGTYVISSLSIPRADISLIGQGRSSTILKLTTPAGQNAITITGVSSDIIPVDQSWGSVIAHLSLNASGNNLMDTYAIRAQYAHGLIIHNCLFEYCHSGISLEDTFMVAVDNVAIFDLKHADGIGVYIDGMLDQHISKIIIENRTPGGYFFEPECGIKIKNSGNVCIESGEIIHCRTGIYMHAQSGDLIEWSRIGNIYVDQCSGAGIDIHAEGTGLIRGLLIDHTWSASATYGIRFRGNGTITGVTTTAARVYNCWSNGISIESGQYICVTAGSRIGQNGFDATGTCNVNGISLTATSGEFNTVFGGKPITVNGVSNIVQNVITSTQVTLMSSAGVQNNVTWNVSNSANGIYLDANIDNVTVTNNYIGAIDGLQTTQEYGISVGAGCDNVIIANNQFVNNNIGPISMSASTKAIIHGNIDANNVVQTLSSMSTIVLGIADIVKITGTTSINGIDGPRWIGRQVTLITTDGAISFTTGNNIAKAFTSSQDVPVLAVFDGTNWYLR